MRVSKKAQAELARLQDRKGRLKPPDVVKAARPKSSPLHPYFQWNDTRAAAAYRLEQARKLIRSVILIIESTDRTIEAVAYVHDPRALGSRFQHVTRLEPATARDMMRAELEAIVLDIGRAEGLAAARSEDLPGMSVKLRRLGSQAEALLKSV